MKTHKDLSTEKERELVLWWNFLEESVNNALIQEKRWNRLKQNWDLTMFFVAVACIDDAIIGLKGFLCMKGYVQDLKLFNVFEKFRKEIKFYHIKDIRNDIIHRERVTKQQDDNKKPLFKKSIIILGGYNFTTDEYRFNIYTIKPSKFFPIIRKFKKDIKQILREKYINFYKVEKIEDHKSIIPFVCLHSFEKQRNSLSRMQIMQELKNQRVKTKNKICSTAQKI